MKSTNGFSLIEMLVTLSIAAVLISYALPSIYDIKSNKILNNERDRLMVSFAYARTYAITQQKQVVVCPSLSGSNCDNQSRWYCGPRRRNSSENGKIPSGVPGKTSSRGES